MRGIVSVECVSVGRQAESSGASVANVIDMPTPTTTQTAPGERAPTTIMQFCPPRRVVPSQIRPAAVLPGLHKPFCPLRLAASAGYYGGSGEIKGDTKVAGYWLHVEVFIDYQTS
jgi:hypothetical protein